MCLVLTRCIIIWKRSYFPIHKYLFIHVHVHVVYAAINYMYVQHLLNIFYIVNECCKLMSLTCICNKCPMHLFLCYIQKWEAFLHLHRDNKTYAADYRAYLNIALLFHSPNLQVMMMKNGMKGPPTVEEGISPHPGMESMALLLLHLTLPTLPPTLGSVHIECLLFHLMIHASFTPSDRNTLPTPYPSTLHPHLIISADTAREIPTIHSPSLPWWSRPRPKRVAREITSEAA